MQTYTLLEFREICSMYVENVLEGLEKYPNLILEGRNLDLRNRIIELAKETEYEAVYADCYYGRIGEEARENIRKAYPEDMTKQLEQLVLSPEKYFLKLDSDWMELLLTLSLDETLFSTFYFPTLGIIIWSNYEQKFPVFFQNEKVKQAFESQCF